MIKNKLKLVKNNSGKFAVASTLTILSLGLAHHCAYADEFKKAENTSEYTNETNVNNSLEPKTVAEASAVVTTAQQQVDEAKTNLDAKESAVTSQSEVVETATSEVNKGEADLVSAQEEHSEVLAIKSTATSEHLSEVALQVKSTEVALNSAVATNKDDKNALSSQSEVVAIASTAVSETNRSASEAAQNVEHLQSLVDISNKTESEIKNERAQISRLENEVSKAEKDIVTATTTAKAELNQKISEKQMELSEKQFELTKLKTDQVSSEKINVVGTNKIVLPNTYKTKVLPALQLIEKSGYTGSDQYYSAVNHLKGTIEANVQSSSYGLWSKNPHNVYRSIEKDRARKIDPNRLSVADQNEMGQFVGDLLNGVRGQLGLTALTLSKSAQEMATAIALQYRKTGYGVIKKPHNFKIVGENATRVGLKNSDSRGYESLGFMGTTTTIDQLKRAFYDSIVYMLFNDVSSSYSHTISLLQNNNNGPYYLGVSSTSSAQHIYIIPSSNIVNASKFSTTPIVLTKGVNNQSKIAKVKDTIATIENQIQVLKEQSQDVSNAASVVQARTKLSQLEKELHNSQEKLSSYIKLSSNKQQLNNDLEAAKQHHAHILEQKISAQNKLIQEIEKYNSLEAKTKQSTEKVTELQDQLRKLNNYLIKATDPDLSTKIENQITLIEKQLADAKETLSVETSTFERLKSELADANIEYVKATKSLSIAQLELDKLELKLQLESEKASGNADKNNISLDSKHAKSLQSSEVTSGKTDKKSDVKDNNYKPYDAKRQMLLLNNAKGTLPKTGEYASLMPLLAGTTMLGLAAAAMKKRYK